jgi:hypothetical protein
VGHRPRQKLDAEGGLRLRRWRLDTGAQLMAMRQLRHLTTAIGASGAEDCGTLPDSVT